MKASIKLRDGEAHSPLLLRAKLPVSALGLPLLSSAAVGGDPADLSLSLRLRTALPSAPALHLSYHPLRRSHPFSLALKSGLGLSGSPSLLLSARLSLSLSLSLSSSPALSFSLHFKPSLGDFSFAKSAAFSSRLDDFVVSASATAVDTSLPLGRRVAVRFRWGVHVPPRDAAPGQRRLPYLTVKKISVEGKKKDVFLDVRDGRVEESGAESELERSGATNINSMSGRDVHSGFRPKSIFANARRFKSAG